MSCEATATSTPAITAQGANPQALERLYQADTPPGRNSAAALQAGQDAPCCLPRCSVTGSSSYSFASGLPKPEAQQGYAPCILPFQ